MDSGLITINDEVKTIMRHLSEEKFYITTKSLVTLENTMWKWINIDVPGAIIYGQPRTGKTKAITYLVDEFSKSYGQNMPVIVWGITDHTPTEKQFYSSFMEAIGLPSPGRFETALVLKTRIINTLTALACETKYRMIILLVDEASELNVKDFIWLMDLYNSLMRNDVLLMTYMFGTYSLKVMKNTMKSNGETQIIGRFMTREHIFMGICQEKELAQCLLALDQTMEIKALANKKIVLPEYFFPAAYNDGKRFSSGLTSAFWNAFLKVQANHGLHTEDGIPMQYIITSFKDCLMTYGRGGVCEKYFPEQEDLETCIIESGYTESSAEIYKSKKKARIS